MYFVFKLDSELLSCIIYAYLILSLKKFVAKIFKIVTVGVFFVCVFFLFVCLFLPRSFI